MEFDYGLLRHLEIFVNGAQFAIELLLALYFLYGSSTRPLFWKVYGAIMCVLLSQAVLDEVFQFMNLWKNLFYYELETIYIFMVVPPFEALMFTLVHQDKGWKEVLRRALYAEVPIVSAMVIHICGVPCMLETTMLYCTLYTIYYICVYVGEIRRFNKNLGDSYSDTDSRSLSWLRDMTIICAVLLLSFVMFAANLSFWSGTLHDVVSTVLFVRMAMYVSVQRTINVQILNSASDTDDDESEEVESEPEEQENRRAKVRNSIMISDDTKKFIASGLETLMTKDMVFLEPDLTIGELAQKVGTNNAYLSYYINNVIKKKFSDYINDMRLDYAQGLLLSDKSMTIDEVAHKSGFNNTATMQRSFNAKNNCTASQYRQSEGKTTSIEIVEQKTADLPVLGVLSQREAEREFREYCFSTYPSYRHRLLNYEPSLTNREIMLSMLIVFGYSKDDVAAALELSMASLNVTRSRLRIKLRLQRTDSLRVMLMHVITDASVQEDSAKSSSEK